MSFLKNKVWPKIKRFWAFIVFPITLLFAYLLGRRSSERLTDEELERIREEINVLRARRAAISGRIDFKEEELKEIDRALVENARKIVEAQEGKSDLTDDEVLARFRELGY